MYLVFGLLFIAAVLFTTNRIRPDLIALSSLVVLVLSGTLSAKEALAAFGNTTVVMIAALFIIGAAITNTGITKFIGNEIIKKIKPGQDKKLISIITSSVALLGSIMSSTGVVMLFVPLVQRLNSITGMNPRKIFMPLAYGGLISGMITLLGTPPNLIIADELSRKGFEPFSLLDFAPIGLTVLFTVVLYFIITDKKDDPINSHQSSGEIDLREMLNKYDVEVRVFSFRFQKEAQFVGKTIVENGFRGEHGIVILGREIAFKRNRWVGQIDIDVPLKTEDVFFAYAKEEDIERFLAKEGVYEVEYSNVERIMINEKFGIAEVIIPYDSSIIGIPIKQLSNKVLDNFMILASRQLGEHSNEALQNHRLRAGETLLVWGTHKNLKKLHSTTGKLLVLDYQKDQSDELNIKKAPIAAGITLLMIVVLILNLANPAIVVLAAAIAMIISGCITMERSYKVISWSTVILIAAMLPFSAALQKTGGVDLIADAVKSMAGGTSPIILLAGIFLITSSLGMFISNTATAVIIAPIAITIAIEMGLSPYPFAMTVAIACSAAYLTPVASPVNMLVVTPGGYSFGDFFKKGIVIYILTAIIALVLIPLLFPL